MKTVDKLEEGVERVLRKHGKHRRPSKQRGTGRVKQSENTVEDYLRDKVKRNGGLCYKFVSPSRRGVPDDLVFMPGGALGLVECKATGKGPTEQQQKHIDEFRALGYFVAVVDHTEAVDELFASFGYTR